MIPYFKNIYKEIFIAKYNILLNIISHDIVKCEIKHGAIVMKNESCFTLAEVLITLGIIGIVAAMTLPSLLGNWKKKTIEARLKKFYSTANQAIILSEVKNGPKEYWPCMVSGCDNRISSSEFEWWYNTYLKDFLNTIRVEHFSDAGGKNTAAYFEDGSVMVIKDGYDIYFYPFAKDFKKEKFTEITEDGNRTRPDSGKTFFAFSFQPGSKADSARHYQGKGIEPYRSLICKKNEEGIKICNTLTREELLNNSEYGCNKSSPYKVYCTALIQENNWEIPEDYPIKF